MLNKHFPVPKTEKKTKLRRKCELGNKTIMPEEYAHNVDYHGIIYDAINIMPITFAVAHLRMTIRRLTL